MKPGETQTTQCADDKEKTGQGERCASCTWLFSAAQPGCQHGRRTVVLTSFPALKETPARGCVRERRERRRQVTSTARPRSDAARRAARAWPLRRPPARRRAPPRASQPPPVTPPERLSTGRHTETTRSCVRSSAPRERLRPRWQAPRRAAAPQRPPTKRSYAPPLHAAATAGRYINCACRRARAQ